MATYLSIDLDYWGMSGAPGMGRMISRVLALNVPTCLVRTHTTMLKHMRKFSFDKLINVDFHSDLCSRLPRDGKQLVLNEGTWGAFVPHRNRGRFEWRLPDYVECVTLKVGLCDQTQDVFADPTGTGWLAAVARVGLRGIDYHDVVAAGFCLSLNWWGLDWDPAYPRHLRKLLGAFALHPDKGEHNGAFSHAVGSKLHERNPKEPAKDGNAHENKPLNSSTKSFKPFPCPGCGESVQLRSGTGRMREVIRGVKSKIPDDFLLPTCGGCGETYMYPEISSTLDKLLMQQN